LTEHDSGLLEEELASINFLSVKKPGSVGWGNVPSPLNIRTTVDMLGLSSGECCTHNRPTWIDLITSVRSLVSTIKLSISSKGLPSLNSFHAWKSQDTFCYYMHSL
jgi:hypothetical protein